MRTFLFVLILFLPALIYLAYVLARRRRAEAAGEPLPVLYGDRGFVLSLSAGFVLMMLGLAYFWLAGGAPSNAEYQPPYYQDGEMVPGHFVAPGNG